MKIKVLRDIYTKRIYVKELTWKEIVEKKYKYQYLVNDKPATLFLDFDNVSTRFLIN